METPIRLKSDFSAERKRETTRQYNIFKVLKKTKLSTKNPISSKAIIQI